MRILVFTLALVLSTAAVATECSYRSVRIDNQLVAVGDSARKAFELGPDREVQLENRYGGAAGVRLDFYERGKTVEIHINRGEVRLICQRSG
jgi:hypothetical protein